MRFCILFLLILSIASSAAELKFCYENTDYYPHINGEFESRKPGIIAEVIKKASERLDIKVKAYRSSWKRCKSDLRKGKADMIAAMIWTSERDLWAVFPKSEGQLDKEKYLWKVEYKLFKNIDSKLSWNGESFNQNKVSIGAPEGYVAYKFLKDRKILSKENYKLDQALKLISRNRLDGYVVEELIGRYTVKNLKLAKSIKVDENSILNSLWYAPLSRKFYRANKELSEKLFLEIRNIRKEHGKEIVDKYIGDN